MYAGTDSETPKRWISMRFTPVRRIINCTDKRCTPGLPQANGAYERQEGRNPGKPVFLRNKGGIKQEPQR